MHWGSNFLSSKIWHFCQKSINYHFKQPCHPTPFKWPTLTTTLHHPSKWHCPLWALVPHYHSQWSNPRKETIHPNDSTPYITPSFQMILPLAKHYPPNWLCPCTKSSFPMILWHFTTYPNNFASYITPPIPSPKWPHPWYHTTTDPTPDTTYPNNTTPCTIISQPLPYSSTTPTITHSLFTLHPPWHFTTHPSRFTVVANMMRFYGQILQKIYKLP